MEIIKSKLIGKEDIKIVKGILENEVGITLKCITDIHKQPLTLFKIILEEIKESLEYGKDYVDLTKEEQITRADLEKLEINKFTINKKAPVYLLSLKAYIQLMNHFKNYNNEKSNNIFDVMMKENLKK